MSISKRESRAHSDEPNVPVVVPSSAENGEPNGDENGAMPLGVTDVEMPVEVQASFAYPEAVTDVPMPGVDDLAAPPHSLP